MTKISMKYIVMRYYHEQNQNEDRELTEHGLDRTCSPIGPRSDVTAWGGVTRQFLIFFFKLKKKKMT